MDTIDILGYVAAFFSTSSSLPQLVKTVKTKSAGDVSSFMFISLLIGLILWVIYSFLLGLWPLFITNILSALFVSANLYFKYKYNK